MPVKPRSPIGASTAAHYMSEVMPVIPRSPAGASTASHYMSEGSTTGASTATHYMSEDCLRYESERQISKDTIALIGSREPPDTSLARRPLMRERVVPVIPRIHTAPLIATSYGSEGSSFASESPQPTLKDTASPKGSKMLPDSSLPRRRLARPPVIERIHTAPLTAMPDKSEGSFASESPRGSPRETSKDTSLARRHLTKESVEPIVTRRGLPKESVGPIMTRRVPTTESFGPIMARRGSMTSRSGTIDEVLVVQQRSNGPSRSLATIPGRSLIEKAKAVLSSRLRRDSHGGTALAKRPVPLPSPSQDDLQSDSSSDAEVPLAWGYGSEASGPRKGRLSMTEVDVAMEDAVASTYEASFHRARSAPSESQEKSYATLQEEPYSQKVLRQLNNKEALEQVAKDRFGAHILALDCDTYKTAADFDATKGRLEAKIESLKTWRAAFLDEAM